MDSYARMAKIVQFLDEHFQDQPSLEQLAQLSGLSPTHFHREFQRWIGVSPKDFVQGLTHKYAKSLLQQGSSVLDAALSAGLSGPGRLHDLCLSIEAITPGAVKSQGEGVSFTTDRPKALWGLAFLLNRIEESVTSSSFSAQKDLT